MTLAGLIERLGSVLTGPTAAEEAALARSPKAVAYDSRKVTQGSVFVALRGLVADGNSFVPQAVSRGAIAVVSEDEPKPGINVPWLRVRDARVALAVIADLLWGQPSAEMTVVGVTGTNGKTTTAYLLAEIFEQAGIRTGMVGTIVYRVAGEERTASRTTPESPDTQQLLREMVDRGCKACVMEVSSHALALARVDGIRFRAAVFTNLSRDHLDFHGDMESYFRSKRRLFDELLQEGGVAVLNADDPRGRCLTDLPRRVVTYAIDHLADVTPGRLKYSLHGLDFDVTTPAGPLHVRSRMVGRPNVYNILAAAATATALNLPPDAIERGLASLQAVPGRFQIVSDSSDAITVLVDYAHTDDALKNLLETARPLATRQLITVFGCGGDRDRSKRPLMGAVVARLSDLVVVTSDNPRSEEPERIVEDIMRGIVPAFERDRAGGHSRRYLTIVDRRQAIERAIAVAEPGDMVLIAGKGHERTQVIGERVLPFDDAAVAREALALRRGAPGSGGQPQ
jgi:UDP-N-acetylmuramoyl-L-alanyl-D-glutamate--2,6-diaminopimelate ligase